MTLSRIQILLTPAALDALDGMQYGLRQIGFRVSASALIEAALLELYSDHERDFAKIAAVVRKHVGDSAARRRTG